MKKFHEMQVGELVKPFTDETWCNDKYQVDIKHLPDGWVWLSIKRKNKCTIKDWRDLQKIKNMLCGEEREGLELYPAESRLVDTSNQYHIFVMPEGEIFPRGYSKRLIIEGHEGGWGKGSKQRKFKPNEKPTDCMSLEEANLKLSKRGIKQERKKRRH